MQDLQDVEFPPAAAAIYEESRRRGFLGQQSWPVRHEAELGQWRRDRRAGVMLGVMPGQRFEMVPGSFFRARGTRRTRPIVEEEAREVPA